MQSDHQPATDDASRRATVMESIETFSASLATEYGDVFAAGSDVRDSAVAAFRAGLPRRRAGRRANPDVLHAARLYDQCGQGKANWHQMAKEVWPGYVVEPPDRQELIRHKLRSRVHSLRHQRKQRRAIER